MKMLRESRLMWVLAAAFAVVSILLFVPRVTDPAFFDSFLADWFATMLGVIVGIPVALWLSRWQQRNQEVRDRATQAKEAQDRKTKILRLVREELAYNRDQLEHSKIDAGDVMQRQVLLNGLKDELWSAFSDGGELQWIRDLELLHVISFAYHYIRRVIYLERLYLEVKRPPAHPRAPAEMVVGWLADLDDEVLQHIDLALGKIDDSLAPLESTKTV